MLNSLFLILMTLFAFIPSVSEACEEAEKELGRISPTQGVELVACGIENKGSFKTAGGLSVQYVKDDSADPLFMSDDFVKTYQIHAENNNFYISEALADIKKFKPYIELKTVCAKGKCKLEDHRCVWKKAELDKKKTSEILFLLKNDKKCKKIPSRLKEIFYLALNGDPAAVQFFSKSKINCSANAEASEEIATYQEDIQRLKKLKCL